MAAAALAGASAFAESRPSNETRGHRGEGGRIERESSRERSSASRRDDSSNASHQREANIERRSRQSEPDRAGSGDRSYRGSNDVYRNTDRSTDRTERYNRDRSSSEWRDRGNYDRGSNSNRDRGTYDQSRSNRDRGSYDQSRSNRDRGSYDQSRSSRDRNNDYHYGRSSGYGRNQYRQPYYSHGRISQVHRYGGGYRIWIVGTPYPFYIPLAYYRHDRFRIGLSISLGGYYNPLGYYDYYDGRDYYDSRYDSRVDGAIRGVVESVDYRRDSFVVRNDATGSFVTVLSRDRRLDVRAGDYVELSGEWTRSGVFTAWDVNFLEDGYRR